MSDLSIQETAEGCILPVRARAGGRKNQLGPLHAGALRAEVTVAPEKGKANLAIIRLLAEKTGLPPSKIVLIGGDTSKDKKFLLKGIAPSALLNVLSDLLS